MPEGATTIWLDDTLKMETTLSNNNPTGGSKDKTAELITRAHVGDTMSSVTASFLSCRKRVSSYSDRRGIDLILTTVRT